jgi:organic hydroperoxide reductase OsmC/OhrA
LRARLRYPESNEYKASTEWDGATGCIASTSIGQEIAFDTPVTYGGRGQGVCPDEVFLCSILSCLNNTFLDFQRRFEMTLVSMHLNGKARVSFDGTGYKVVGIAVSGAIVVGKGDLETGQHCLELMKEYCHLGRSLKECIPVQYDITVSEAAPTKDQKKPGRD